MEFYINDGVQIKVIDYCSWCYILWDRGSMSWCEISRTSRKGEDHSSIAKEFYLVPHASDNSNVKLWKQCSRRKKASRHQRGDLSMFHAGFLCERLHVDYLGLFAESLSGYKYILMVNFQLTKWLEAYPLTDQAAEEVAKAVVNNFTSKIFEEICQPMYPSYE